MQAGYDGLLRDKTRPSRIPPLGSDIAKRVVALTRTDPPAEATHWTATMMAKAVGISASFVQRIWRTHGLQPHRVHQSASSVPSVAKARPDDAAAVASSTTRRAWPRWRDRSPRRRSARRRSSRWWRRRASSLTAIWSDQRALAGRNGAGFCMSLPDCRPSDVQHAVARHRVDDAGGTTEAAAGKIAGSAGNAGVPDCPAAAALAPAREPAAPAPAPGAAPRRRLHRGARAWRAAPRALRPHAARCAGGAAAPAAPARPPRRVRDRRRVAPCRSARLRPARRRRCDSRRGRRRIRRHAPAAGAACDQIHDACGRRGDAAGTRGSGGGQRQLEVPLPHRVAGVVVDRVDVVRSCRRRATSARTASRRSPSRPASAWFHRAAGWRAWPSTAARSPASQPSRPRSPRRSGSRTCAAHRPGRSATQPPPPRTCAHITLPSAQASTAAPTYFHAHEVLLHLLRHAEAVQRAVERRRRRPGRWQP